MAGAATGLLRDRIDHVFHHAGEVKDDLGPSTAWSYPPWSFSKACEKTNASCCKNWTSPSPPKKTLIPAKQRRYQRFFYQESIPQPIHLNSFPQQRSAAALHCPHQFAAGRRQIADQRVLAKTLSELGQRLLLIDADLRKPQMHVRLGLNNLSGLSNVLTEDDQTWSDVVQNVPGYDN